MLSTLSKRSALALRRFSTCTIDRSLRRENSPLYVNARRLQDTPNVVIPEFDGVSSYALKASVKARGFKCDDDLDQIVDGLKKVEDIEAKRAELDVEADRVRALMKENPAEEESGSERIRDIRKIKKGLLQVL